MPPSQAPPQSRDLSRPAPRPVGASPARRSHQGSACQPQPEPHRIWVSFQAVGSERAWLTPSVLLLLPVSVLAPVRSSVTVLVPRFQTSGMEQQTARCSPSRSDEEGIPGGGPTWGQEPAGRGGDRLGACAGSSLLLPGGHLQAALPRAIGCQRTFEKRERMSQALPRKNLALGPRVVVQLDGSVLLSCLGVLTPLCPAGA